MSHFGFITTAYVLTALVIGGLIAWVLLDGRALRHRIAELEARGIRRRSDSTGNS